MFLKPIRQLNRSLIFRLTAIYALAFAVIASVGFTVVYHQLHAMAMAQMDEELVDEVEIFMARVAEIGWEATINRVIDEVAEEDPDEEFYRLFDTTGQTIMSTDLSAWEVAPPAVEIRALRDSGRPYRLQTIKGSDQDFETRAITALVDGNRILQIGETLEEVADYLGIFLSLFAVLTILLTLITVVVGWGIARWSLSDLAAVSRTAENIAGGNYAHRVAVKGNLAEIDRLAATFNRMLDRILGLMSSMRDINDSIAHDLRSPLARIRGIAEMTLTEDKPLADFKEMASSTIEDCDELISLINTMLDITETEAGVARAESETFDIVRVLSEACELFRPLADEKQIVLVSTLPTTQRIIGDRKRMQRVITNLLENAIKYTNTGGTVSVAVETRGQGIAISVADSGMGIPAADLPHIYDRFFRGDKSRPQGGFGLGLSLAKAYTESMNGRIDVHSTVDKGSVFTLSFE
ncbi:MAG: HAMP domain-containing sensor histidine kinase [Desulfobacterales bacterium]|jgi:signal transduction histidine kinase